MQKTSKDTILLDRTSNKRIWTPFMYDELHVSTKLLNYGIMNQSIVYSALDRSPQTSTSFAATILQQKHKHTYLIFCSTDC